MRLPPIVIVFLAFVIAASLSVIAANLSVSAVEDNTEIAVRRTLDLDEHGWAEVEANGLQVLLSGTAPDEAARFDALSSAAKVVDAQRIIDEMDVTPTAALSRPSFSAEILRNDSGISMIGLVPASTDRARLIRQLTEIAGRDRVSDLLETADYTPPEGWSDALGFSVSALSKLPRSKISVQEDHVYITAITDSTAAKRALERDINRAAPPGLRLSLTIAAPRPVITPFTLRFLIDEKGARFDACSAESDTSRSRILDAAFKAGLSGNETCIIGMGVPSPNWAEAVEKAILALAELGGGSVTFSDADVTLVARENTNPGLFDRVIGELETALPDVFDLHPVLPVADAPEQAGPPEFVATLSPEGLVQLRGRLSGEPLRDMADSFARAHFGSANVYTAARIVPDLPKDWPIRVLAGLEALSQLTNGVLTVTPTDLTLSGASFDMDASETISRLLSQKLGEAETYELDITYREPPIPEDLPPPPEICAEEIVNIQEQGKITFEPGSATITEDALATMDAIADILSLCGDLRLEIQGHTDSQGRESMNKELSQSRAQSVLNELRARRVLTSSYSAVGYGESQPIADNKTEEGREANRRIEFKLILPEPIPETSTALEAMEEEAANAAAEPAEEADTDTSASDATDPTASSDAEEPENEQN